MILCRCNGNNRQCVENALHYVTKMITSHYSPLRPTPDKLKPLLELADMLEPKPTLPVFDVMLAHVESEWSEEDELREYARAHKIDLRNAELAKTVEAAFKFSAPYERASKALNECLKDTSSQF